MTQNIPLGTTQNGSTNPLYIKMRRRFSCQGNCTVGEMMMQRASREGYDPRSMRVAKSREDFGSTLSHVLPEGQIKNANFLPKSHDDTMVVNLENRARTEEREKRVFDSSVRRSLEHTIVHNASKITRSTAVKNAKSSLPIGLICAIVLCAALMMILVYSGVQMSRLSREVSSLQSQALELKKTEAELEVKLEEKNNMTLIESIATNELGMVKQSAVEHIYIGVFNDDNAEVYESEDDSTLITNLLNAFTESFN